jgi:hypothetical protein
MQVLDNFEAGVTAPRQTTEQESTFDLCHMMTIHSRQ